MGKNLILDFDGTLTHLSVDWSSLRNIIGLERLSDYFKLPKLEQDYVLETISKTEYAGLVNGSLIDISILEKCESWSVLTNNCEETVWSFIERERISKKPIMVLGRESLGGPKEDFTVFTRAIELITAIYQRHEALYVGDSDYEIQFAKRLGLVTHLVPPHNFPFEMC
jgi:phosphoglycolate phosphatase-like HAD superfamily hydrolase